MFQAEVELLRKIFKKTRPTVRETMLVAGLYAGQAVVSVVALQMLYRYEHWPAVLWAMISVILALQPGLSQSAATSVLRILANTLGAGVALAVAAIPIRHELQLLLSLVVVIFACELLRLDLALRTACVAVIIVLTSSEGHVLTSGIERFNATVLGCLMALIVQLMTDLFLKRILLHSRKIEAVKS